MDKTDCGLLPKGFRYFFYPVVLLMALLVLWLLYPTPIPPVVVKRPPVVAPAATGGNVIFGYNSGSASTGTSNIAIGYTTKNAEKAE